MAQPLQKRIPPTHAQRVHPHRHPTPDHGLGYRWLRRTFPCATSTSRWKKLSAHHLRRGSSAPMMIAPQAQPQFFQPSGPVGAPLCLSSTPRPRPESLTLPLTSWMQRSIRLPRNWPCLMLGQISDRLAGRDLPLDHLLRRPWPPQSARAETLDKLGTGVAERPAANCSGQAKLIVAKPRSPGYARTPSATVWPMRQALNRLSASLNCVPRLLMPRRFRRRSVAEPLGSQPGPLLERTRRSRSAPRWRDGGLAP